MIRPHHHIDYFLPARKTESAPLLTIRDLGAAVVGVAAVYGFIWLAYAAYIGFGIGP